MDAVLGHVIPGISQVYDRHHYMPQKTDALAAWERHLRTLVGIADNVVAISTAQRS